MALDYDIQQLLYQHDCVIVPGFGGFLTHYRPARLDQQRRLVHPPSKELSFNRHLTRHDGLLVDRLVRHEGMDFNAAKAKVEEELAGWQQLLKRDGRLELANIGTFFHDAEQNLQFEPDKRVNYLKDAFGLRPVAAVPVVRTMSKVVPSPGEVRIQDVPKEERGGLRPMLAVAASVAIVLTAATWWAVAQGELPSAAWLAFDKSHVPAPALYVPPAPPAAMALMPLEALVWSSPKELQGIHELPIAGPEAPLVAVNLGQAPAKAVPESTSVATASPESGPRFHIIGGCFLEKENADRFVSELQAKGFAASLLDRKGGLYRVAYGSYPQREMALDALSAVRKEVAPQAWLLVK